MLHSCIFQLPCGYRAERPSLQSRPVCLRDMNMTTTTQETEVRFPRWYWRNTDGFSSQVVLPVGLVCALGLTAQKRTP